jgi:hypothetical protein
MFTSVAKPIGTVPKKSDWTGWRSMSVHVAGYRVWRKIEIRRMRVKKKALRMKNMMLRVRREDAWEGYRVERVCRRTDTMPVPIVVANCWGR